MDAAGIVVAVGEFDAPVGVFAGVHAAGPGPVAGDDAAAGAEGDGGGEHAAGEEGKGGGEGGGGFHGGWWVVVLVWFGWLDGEFTVEMDVAIERDVAVKIMMVWIDDGWMVYIEI